MSKKKNPAEVGKKNWDKENVEMDKDMKKEDVRNEIAKLGL